MFIFLWYWSNYRYQFNTHLVMLRNYLKLSAILRNYRQIYWYRKFKKNYQQIIAIKNLIKLIYHPPLISDQQIKSFYLWYCKKCIVKSSSFPALLCRRGMFAGGVEEGGDQARHSRLPHVTVVTPECHSFSIQWELQWRFNRYEPTVFYARMHKTLPTYQKIAILWP